MRKKIIFIFTIIILILGLASQAIATELKTALDVVEKKSETKYLENEQGYITKEIVSSNPSSGEITIELKIANTSEETETTKSAETEVVFVVDNSVSMEEKVSETQTRRDVVISSAKEFTSQLFKDIENVKVGLVYYYAFDVDVVDGVEVPTQDYGTLETAKVLSNLTDNGNTIQNALTSLSSMPYTYGTNTDAGLQKAKSMFSSNNNARKFIILLSDGVPNHATGVSIYSNLENYTNEQRQADINTKTKATINEINNAGINLITILTGLSDLTEDDTAVLETVFGTETNPTAGSLYNIADTDISRIIKEQIYAEILESVKTAMTKIEIVDYFPEDITENFDFEYIGNPDKGSVSNSIDTNTHSITWTIDTLKSNETASLKYKLKIKDMNNSNLLNKKIYTNEKVEVTYKDADLKDYTVTLLSSPSIILEEADKSEKLVTEISYSTTATTEDTVITTIKSDKELKAIDGWILSNDKKTLTKEYTSNIKETIHVVAEDGTEEEVTIDINNIASSGSNYAGVLPDAGLKVMIIGIVIIAIMAIIAYRKYKKYEL